MAFRVEKTGLGEQSYGDQDVYDFLAGGVLRIHRAESMYEDEHYPAHKWDFVGADTDHGPGKARGPER